MIQIDSYELVITALKDPVAADIRLRRVLKSLLRTYGFRCDSVRPVDLESEKAAKPRTRANKTSGRKVVHNSEEN